ncbi:hypothetical protein CEE69_20910 [Rhodopirellula bahusiensis]|uniref:Transmembrane protein n=1 Tax=Rhodopirellula bahusiensis TaxID=2014065 RepID=A0A2G1W359_9BACT|nr:hypothetical protein CEE69_20910 [Rhodopirellula bahusiensis]
MNPYEPAELSHEHVGQVAPHKRPPIATVTALASIAFAVFVLASSCFDSAAWFLRARFGDEFPVPILLPAIALATWLFRPTSRNLAYASLSLFVVAAIHYFQLSAYTHVWETVDTVYNSAHDRLHSSFWWCVFPFAVAGVLLAFTSFRLTLATAEFRNRG